MTIIIFLIILSVLVLVHEFGHFLAAKMSDMRVDEFGLGFPPRAKKLFSWKGTDFTLNWLPFGGFVKIFGENGEEGEAKDRRGFSSKNRAVQASVLVAGIFGNLLFAWFLISLGFMIGLPASSDFGLPINNPHTIITEVLAGSPADLAGLKPEDSIISLSRGNIYSNLTPDAAANFISASPEAITFVVERDKKQLTETITPKQGIVAGKTAVGIAMDTIGTVKLSLFSAIWHGLTSTISLTAQTAQALGTFIAQAFVGHADFSQVTGPVGLVGLVGDASRLGFVYLLSFMALISMNLAVINILPFPALDGGRLLFVIIEAIRRKPISPKVANTLNTVGFFLLVLAMLAITFRDVVHLI